MMGYGGRMVFNNIKPKDFYGYLQLVEINPTFCCCNVALCVTSCPILHYGNARRVSLGTPLLSATQFVTCSYAYHSRPFAESRFKMLPHRLRLRMLTCSCPDKLLNIHIHYRLPVWTRHHHSGIGRISHYTGSNCCNPQGRADSIRTVPHHLTTSNNCW